MPLLKCALKCALNYSNISIMPVLNAVYWTLNFVSVSEWINSIQYLVMKAWIYFYCQYFKNNQLSMFFEVYHTVCRGVAVNGFRWFHWLKMKRKSHVNRFNNLLPNKTCYWLIPFHFLLSEVWTSLLSFVSLFLTGIHILVNRCVDKQSRPRWDAISSGSALFAEIDAIFRSRNTNSPDMNLNLQYWLWATTYIKQMCNLI